MCLATASGNSERTLLFFPGADSTVRYSAVHHIMHRIAPYRFHRLQCSQPGEAIWDTNGKPPFPFPPFPFTYSDYCTYSNCSFMQGFDWCQLDGQLREGNRHSNPQHQMTGSIGAPMALVQARTRARLLANPNRPLTIQRTAQLCSIDCPSTYRRSVTTCVSVTCEAVHTLLPHPA